MDKTVNSMGIVQKYWKQWILKEKKQHVNVNIPVTLHKDWRELLLFCRDIGSSLLKNISIFK